MEQLSEHQVQAWMNSPLIQPPFQIDDDPPPSLLEVFIAELMLVGVSADDMKRLIRKANHRFPTKPQSVMARAREIARLLDDTKNWC
jgi:hypothetical protein